MEGLSEVVDAPSSMEDRDVVVSIHGYFWRTASGGSDVAAREACLLSSMIYTHDKWLAHLGTNIRTFRV